MLRKVWYQIRVSKRCNRGSRRRLFRCSFSVLRVQEPYIAVYQDITPSLFLYQTSAHILNPLFWYQSMSDHDASKVCSTVSNLYVWCSKNEGSSNQAWSGKRCRMHQLRRSYGFWLDDRTALHLVQVLIRHSSFDCPLTGRQSWLYLDESYCLVLTTHSQRALGLLRQLWSTLCLWSLLQIRFHSRYACTLWRFRIVLGLIANQKYISIWYSWWT